MALFYHASEGVEPTHIDGITLSLTPSIICLITKMCSGSYGRVTCGSPEFREELNRAYHINVTEDKRHFTQLYGVGDRGF